MHGGKQANKACTARQQAEHGGGSGGGSHPDRRPGASLRNSALSCRCLLMRSSTATQGPPAAGRSSQIVASRAQKRWAATLYKSHNSCAGTQCNAAVA